MSYHGTYFTSPAQDEEYIDDSALYQHPEGPVAYAYSPPPRVQHQGPVTTQDHGTFTSASMTEAVIQPTAQVHQPYAHPYTEGVVQYGYQNQQYDSGSLHFDRPTMSAEVEPQEAWSSENYFQQQPAYVPTYTLDCHIPLEQPAANHNALHQPITQTIFQNNNPSKDMDADSAGWRPGVCQDAYCLAKPSEKQKNYEEYSDWRGHWHRVHQKQYQCPIDGAIFGTANELKRHEEAKHQTGAKRYSCHIAGCNARARDFNRRDKFQEHNGRWHGPYYCSVRYCKRGYGNGFKEEVLLMDHKRSCHGTGDFS